jgi:Mg/Co/Ni transporter MgtE
MFKRNPFEKPTEKELIDRKAKEEALKAISQEVIEAAQRLLDYADAKRYRELLEKMEADTYEYLTSYPANEDPIKDAYQVRVAINQLMILKTILRKADSDARRK